MCVATIAIAGAALGAGSAVMGGISAANQASYQAKIAQNNALIERQNAEYSASAAASKTEQAGMQARAKLAELRAAEAANGIDVNTGSAADVQDSEHRIGDLDTRTVSNNSALQVYGYQAQSNNFSAQAAADQSAASNDIAGGIMKGAGSLISNSSVDAAITGGGGTALDPMTADSNAMYDSTLGASNEASISSQFGGSMLSGDSSLGSDYMWMRG